MYAVGVDVSNGRSMVTVVGARRTILQAQIYRSKGAIRFFVANFLPQLFHLNSFFAELRGV